MEEDAGYESFSCYDNKLLTKVECIGVEKRTRPSKHHVYVLVVCWSDGVKYPIYRRYISFFDLKICLKEEFKDRPDFIEPELPALKHFERGWLFGSKETAMEKRKRYINTFCQHILQLPEDMVRSSSVVSFYETWESDFEQQNNVDYNYKRKNSAPALPVATDTGVTSQRRISQPFGRFPDRRIPDLLELSRPRAASLIEDAHAVSVPPSDRVGSKSLPRGVSLDTGTDEPLGQQYRVTCDYTRRRPGEVDLHEGQLVEVIERNLTGWWFVHVTDAQSQEGWAPGAFLAPVAPSLPMPCKTRCESDDTSDGESVSGVYETICDHRGEKEDEVSYTRGQQVEVVQGYLDGWWKIRLPDSTEGFTPAINLRSTKKQQPQITPHSRFHKRSLRERGPPPRGKPREDRGAEQDYYYYDDDNDEDGDKGETRGEEEEEVEGTQAGPELEPQAPTSNEDLNDPPPLYSVVMKLSKEPGAQARPAQSQPGRPGETKQNYIDVVFVNEEEPSTAEIKRRDWRRDRVDYVEINPRPLPPSNPKQTKAAKQQGSHGNGSPPSRQVGAERSSPAAARASPGPAETEALPTTTPTPTATGPVSRARSPRPQIKPDYPSSSSPTPEGKTHPVPKPRRLGGKPPPVPTYENTSELLQAPQRPVTEGDRKQPAGEISDDKASAASGGSRYLNYENHAVAFVTDLIRSSSESKGQEQPDASFKPKPATTSVTPTVSPVGQKKMAGLGVDLDPSLVPMMVQLPPMPSKPSPVLPPDAAIWWSKLPEVGDSNMAEAIGDFEPTGPDDKPTILSFKKGETAVVVRKETRGWLGVKIGERGGWVPAQYWTAYQPRPQAPKRNIQNLKQVEDPREQPGFLGKMTRQEAEDILMQYGSPRDFLIRESTNRLGDLTLSVQYQDRARHFPIHMTAHGKYDIGRAHFTDLSNVVSYYKTNPLFFDEQNNNAPIFLGKPIRCPKNTRSEETTGYDFYFQ